jgi:polysaccharide export outer membrane protein
MTKLETILHTITFTLLLASCGAASKIVYVQDIQNGIPVAVQEVKPLTLKQGDKITITVFSRDAELAKMFNLNSGTSGESGRSGKANCYTVGADGKIDMPTLGPITAEGMTRMELANEIKYKLLSSQMLRDLVVTVEYTNMGFYALGEVGHTGRIEIENDHLTILEAIAEAGDLTIAGKRENVLVLRTENGVQTPYRVDLTNAQSIYSSPVYYVQQNDIIYVEPTQVKANQSKLNANNARTPTFWISMCSMVVSLALLIIKL